MHWTFLALIVVVVWASAGSGRAGELAALAWVAVIFGSVLVHELAHCVVARRHDVVVDDILLIPLGGISQMESIPEVPKEELAIAVVGPLTSFALAVAVAVCAVPFHVHLWPPTLFGGSWAARVVWLNVLLGAFNFVPALPMDGGRVLRAALALHHDRRTATLWATRVARYLAVGMIVVGVVYNFWLVFIGFFVFLGAAAEEQAVDSDHHDHDSRTPSGRPPW